MTRSLHFTAFAFAIVVLGWVADAGAKSDPKPLDPARTLKPQAEEGYYDDAFGLDAEGKQLAVIRTDAVTFAKLELIDAATGAVKSSFDLPSKTLVATDIEVLSDGKGVVVIARDKPDDQAPVFAYRFDAAGKLAAKVGPATAFSRPPADGTARAKLLIGFDRKLGTRGAEATYTITAYDLATLAPAGKPHVHRVDMEGQLKAPPLRLIGFFDGYTRMLAERPGAYDKKADVRAPPKMAVVDAVTGKVTTEAQIADVVGWAYTGKLRRENPGRSMFVELNEDTSSVDVVDAMGKKQPAALAVPLRLYDPKSLRVEEGPGTGKLTFAIAVDPLNPDAIQRRKVDLPMLDVYTTDVAQGAVKLRGRVFIPRPVAWRLRGDTLVVLKRFKSFARGGDELQIYDLR
jgi:hypothetical protein